MRAVAYGRALLGDQRKCPCKPDLPDMMKKALEILMICVAYGLLGYLVAGTAGFAVVFLFSMASILVYIL